VTRVTFAAPVESLPLRRQALTWQAVLEAFDSVRCIETRSRRRGMPNTSIPKSQPTLCLLYYLDDRRQEGQALRKWTVHHVTAKRALRQRNMSFDVTQAVSNILYSPFLLSSRARSVQSGFTLGGGVLRADGAAVGHPTAAEALTRPRARSAPKIRFKLRLDVRTKKATRQECDQKTSPRQISNRYRKGTSRAPRYLGHRH
jgi:hypothetical protein